MPKAKQLLQDLIKKQAAEWLDVQPARLGDGTGTDGGTVFTDIAGTYNARLINGKVIQVYNQARTAPIPDLDVLIGRRKGLISDIPQIISDHEVYSAPAASGQIEYHHPQHEEGGSDRLNLDRKQIIQLTVRVSDAANFIVTIYGGLAGNIMIATQTVDLSSYVITAGAKYVAIESDNSGVLSVQDGSVIGSPDIATAADLPVPASGKYTVAWVLFYESQSELADSDIVVPMPTLFNPLAYSSASHSHDIAAQIHAASASAVTDDDEFGFWENVSGLLKKITWANIVATLTTVFDALYAPIAKGVTNGDSHDHNGGDGAQISFLTLSNLPTAQTNANDLFRCNSCSNPAFSSTIATLPGGAVLTYNAPTGNENVLVPASTSQLAKMRLYNTTRGTSALILDCVIATNTITLTANVPAGWQVGDTITIASQTVSGGGLNWVDLEIVSGEYLNKSTIGLYIAFSDSAGAGFSYAVHPFEAYANSKIVVFDTTQSTQLSTKQWAYYKLVSNVITVNWTASGAATALIAIREAGYLS